MTTTFHIHHIHSESSLINHPIIRHYTIYAVERRVVMEQAVAYYTDFITALFAFRLLLGSTVQICNEHSYALRRRGLPSLDLYRLSPKKEDKCGHNG
jgi:hypothetical protein